MTWRERISSYTEWAGWRRHAPAAGSVAAHLVVVGVFASMMAAVTAEDAPRPPRPDPKLLSVELLQLPETPIEAGVTPPPRAKPDAPSQPTPDKRKPLSPATAAPATGAPSDTGAPDDNTFYIPPSDAPTGVAKGLASLMGDDACEARYGPKARECAGRDLAKRTGNMDSVMSRPKEQLAQYFGEFMPKCTMRVGCEEGEWISINGTRSTGKPPPGSRNDHGVGSPGAGGAASVGGINTIVGRLGFNREHTDPGFGD